MKYQLEIKQLVRFPYCRIYRELVNNIIESPKIHKRGSCLLFPYIVLFSLVNYRNSIRNMEGMKLSIRPGEWAERYCVLCEKLNLRYHYQLVALFRRMKDMELIEFEDYPKQRIIKYRIKCWAATRKNTRISCSPWTVNFTNWLGIAVW